MASRLLLDTNVVSEIRKAQRADPRFLECAGVKTGGPIP